MKILLIGEFSNVHWTLAEGLRTLGHTVTVMSSGDGWKEYKRDIDIKFNSRYSLIKFLYGTYRKDILKGFDVVQLINFNFFFSSKSAGLNKYLFDFLKKYNGKVFLAAYGDDYFWVNGCVNGVVKYSPFDVLKSRDDAYVRDVLKLLQPESKRLNAYIADKVDGIISCMYDYYAAYVNDYPEKLHAVPLPVNTGEINFIPNQVPEDGRVRIFVGVQQHRDAWKGTDIIVKVLRKYEKLNRDKVEVKVVSNVSYSEYVQLYNEANIMFDQVYSYGQGMNALGAMAKGKILFGGAEPESYDLFGETENFPIINITPNEDEMYSLLDRVINMKDSFPTMGLNSRKYIEKQHDHVKVARQYLEIYQ